MGLATESEIDAFCRALSDRFKLTEDEAHNLLRLTPLGRLAGLRQGSSEDLEQYYECARDLLLAMHGRDGMNDALTPSEISLRTIAVSIFCIGISSKMLRLRLYQQHIYHHSVSLHQAFKMAEAEMKTMEEEAQSADGEEKEQEGKKRKLSTDSEERNNARRQKHMIVRLKLRTTTTTKVDGSAGRAEQAAKKRIKSSLLTDHSSVPHKASIRLHSKERGQTRPHCS